MQAARSSSLHPISNLGGPALAGKRKMARMSSNGLPCRLSRCSRRRPRCPSIHTRQSHPFEPRPLGPTNSPPLRHPSQAFLHRSAASRLARLHSQSRAYPTLPKSSKRPTDSGQMRRPRPVHPHASRVQRRSPSLRVAMLHELCNRCRLRLPSYPVAAGWQLVWSRLGATTIRTSTRPWSMRSSRG